MLINKRESKGLKYLNDSKAFIAYSNDRDDIYKYIDNCNPNKKQNILIVFDDMIVDILNPIVTELFVTGKKINVPFVCIT